MDTQALLDNISTISSDNAIIVDAKEFLTELRQVAGAVAKPREQRPNLTFVHMILMMFGRKSRDFSHGMDRPL